jgi:hypothetical protein
VAAIDELLAHYRKTRDQMLDDIKHWRENGWKLRRNNEDITEEWLTDQKRRADTRQYIKAHGGRPNKIRVWFNLTTQDFWRQQYDIDVRDENDSPLWLVHPAMKVDIAIVPLRFTPEQLMLLSLYPMNKITTSNLLVYIGMEVFILGYPFGVRIPQYPVWKRGSIASEPDLAPLTDGFLMVDTASRPGMSGAPVILRSADNNHLYADGTTGPLPVTTRTRFLGVYSGRIPSKTNMDAQIGMVWPGTAIEEIIACNIRDTD